MSVHSGASSVGSGSRRRGDRIQLLPVLALTLVWVLFWGSYSLVSIAGGVLLALALVVLFPLPRLDLRLTVRPLPFLVLISRFALDLVVASVHVAYQVAAPWVTPRGHLLTVDLRTDDDLVAFLTAEMTALVPGTVVVDVDPERHRLVVHVFDIAEADLPAQAEKVRDQERRILRALARDADQYLGGDR